MNFTPITLSTTAGSTSLLPYDRGAKGAFVYRDSAKQLHSKRFVVSLETRDDGVDRSTIQLNAPREPNVAEGCCPTLGATVHVDILKVNLGFRAETASADRIKDIDLLVAMLEHLKATIAAREKLYS